MNLDVLLQQSMEFVARWCGTALPRIVIAFLGLAILVRLGIAAWERRLRWPATVLGGLGGVLLLVVALDPHIARWFVQTTHLTRIRIVMALLSVIVVGITVESIRRSRLQERYALLWIATGLIILLCAFFPHALDLFGALFGTQYVTSVVAVVFTFLVLVAFHFSIAMSGFQQGQRRLSQRHALLEAEVESLRAEVRGMQQKLGLAPAAPAPAAAAPVEWTSPAPSAAAAPGGRSIRGARLAAWLLVGAAIAGPLAVGLLAPQAMVGDEVTHYYMLASQAESLPLPAFTARIPTGWGADEVRTYPHTFLWHYLGAVVHRATGGSFAAVQLFQVLFWAQLLYVAFRLARSRSGPGARAVPVYLLMLASLPVGLIFAVTFYQDVPLTAQILTAFFLLSRGRWLASAVFLVLAMAIKETAVLFLPAWFAMLAFGPARPSGRARTAVAAAVSLALLVAAGAGIRAALLRYAGAEFYPVEMAQRMVRGKMGGSLSVPVARPPEAGVVARVTPYEAQIIANHPGDLRIPENFVVYGGALMWIVIATGLGAWLLRRRSACDDPAPADAVWPLAVGGSYALLTAWLIRSAPDARFFLPALPFLLLPAAEWTARLPRPRLWVPLLASLAILQAGAVLDKVYRLRHVPAGVVEAAQFLAGHRPEPARIFMYPEGSYRLFPVPHDWYLRYRLREFWRADNDTRIRMLQDRHIGAIVVKKHLVGPVDDAITNLGIYPDYFVKQIAADPRFVKVHENPDVAIFTVPPAEARP